MTVNQLGGPQGEIRLLRTQIAALRRERDDLIARARARSAERGQRLALRIGLAALWLIGAAAALVLLLYALLMSGVFRMGPG